MEGATQIRQARSQDLEQLLHLEELCFNEESFSRQQLRYLSTRAKADFLLTEEAGEITAFIVLLKRKNSSGLRIYSLAVSPRHRGKGLARLLLAEAGKRAQTYGISYLTLEVSAFNEPAVCLYKQQGFEVFGERPAYYKNGSKALLMRKKVG
ncbi:GNAT family N-acetyltransferase [Gaoshiqia sediminis]|uniref:GNAT family N-acetyltransferase n=1 Tax=Gaoshiqia sediminis TaxID=2986998 RepID=A0AA41Y8U2_9BACT|nr:N-acetyltransferase [Gaoshiqia sediminis]MCW0484005.1 GNAT family N-acetyltransferase [Gaoshiqia sediminis]